MKMNNIQEISKYLSNEFASRFNNNLPFYNDINSISKTLSTKLNENNLIYSFDIFDTVLIRNIEPPNLIKQLAAKYLSERFSENNINIASSVILKNRRSIEIELQNKAFKNGNDRECVLEDVVRELLKRLDTSKTLDYKIFIDYELKLEISATCAMPGILNILRNIKLSKKRIIGITETYLSKIQINRILEYHGLRKYFDELYVSSDIGLSKNTGNLFRYVIKKENVNIIHVGDNYIQDNRIPARLGIKTYWLHDKAELKRKSKLRKLQNKLDRMKYVNAVIMRNHEENRNTLYEIGYNILGPALTIYIHNLAEQSQKDKIQRMYFIARDGYILKKIYDIVRSNIYKDNLPQSKYMCISRLSVRLASLQNFGINEINACLIRDHLKYITLRNLFNSYGLEPSEFVEIANKYGIELSYSIYHPEQDSRLCAFLYNHEFQCKIMRRSLEAKNILREYLLNIGFIGSGNVAFIDAQGTGVSQMLLEQAFHDDKGYPFVHGYYFGLTNNGSNLNSPNINGIIFDWRKDPENEMHLFGTFGSIIELFSHPNHGMTYGYQRRSDGIVIPIFRKTPAETQYLIRSKLKDGILAYARDYAKYNNLVSFNVNNLLKDEKKKIKQWIAFPPKKDIYALTNIIAIDDWPIEKSIPLIKQLKGVDLLSPNTFAIKVTTSLWPEGSLRTAPIPKLNWLFYELITNNIIGYKIAMTWVRSNISKIKL
jgi:predicted HAD superfamily hydrolase